MRTDLVSVLSEGSLREHTEEAVLLLSRAYQEAQRTEWIDQWLKEAADADAAGTPDEAAARARALVSKLVHATPGIVEGTDREVEGLFNLLLALVFQHFADDEAARAGLLEHMAVSVGDIESATAAERSVVRYRILANIFNMLPASAALRLRVFRVLLALAAANGDMDFLQAALASLPTWLAQWDVSAEEKNACLSNVVAALHSPECGPEYVSQAYQYNLLYLRYISGETALPTATRHAAAERAIADVLRLPKLFELEDMIHVQVVRDLDGTPIHRLLHIFVQGTRRDLEVWLVSEQSTCERLALQRDELIRKMRLLDLASLCARSVSAEVSYASIADTLGVPLDDVESWVIDVIRAGLVSGRLSQVKQSFRVYRSTHRAFEKEQWAALEKRLTEWQSSIQSLVKTMDHAVQHGRPLGAPGGLAPEPAAGAASDAAPVAETERA
ncbi:hypothetical protein MSPP1_004047 [Malassezia sp. CBS 17886]|nr:hypothetical protein MSPP1_004047 [Malassezia sp. CBS 17886]